jgi:Ca2+-binding EF-hand superfamily protein
MSEVNFSEHQLDVLREAFELFDKDGNGGITQSEMVAIMRDFGQTLDDFVMGPLFHDADHNNDGLLSFAEFKRFVSELDPDRDDHRAVHRSLAIFVEIRDRAPRKL